jgi:hypothetical protein
MKLRALIFEARVAHSVGSRAGVRAYARPYSKGASLARKKAFDFSNQCDGLLFRVKELDHLVKRVDNAMAKQLVKKIGMNTKALCKSTSHLKDIMRKHDPQGHQAGKFVTGAGDPKQGRGWKS